METVKQVSLEVRNLTCGYKAGVDILKGMEFSARGGELVSLLGKNGAGKSTLFKCILGLMREYTGQICIDGTDMKELSARGLAKKVAYIPQSHYPSFNYSVLDMVLMGSANQISSVGSPGAKEEEKAMEAIRRVGIEKLTAKGFGQISGGEQQLVLMARAVLQDARIWILDEPLASLDYGNQIRVLKQLKELARDGYLILQSIHNPDQAFRYSDRILAMRDGKILQEGAPRDIMDSALIRLLYGEDAAWERPDRP